MPLAFALVGSLLVHLGVLFGPDWELGGLPGPDTAVALEAVIAAPSVVGPAANPVRPPPRLARQAQRKKPVAALPESSRPQEPEGAVAPAPSFVPPLAESPPTVGENTDASSAANDVIADASTSVPAPAPQPIALPARGHMEFELSRGESGFVIGRTVHDWEHDGQRYRAKSVTETTGIAAVFKPARVVQVSEGEVDAGGLRPHSFRHEKVKGIDSARFDWTRRLLSYEDKEVALPDGTQDMLSFYFQAAMPPLPEHEMVLPIATGRKLEVYRFEPRGAEQLEINSKQWRTWRYSAKSGNDRIELWIAPDQPGLPLKIRFIDQKGDIYDQIAVQIHTKEIQ